MYIFIIVILIILIPFVNFMIKNKDNRVKKIWTYLDKDKNPCMESWKKHYPDYEITVLNKKNFFKYINIPIEISHPNLKLTDLVRLFALDEFGGIWIDHSIVLKAPANSRKEFAGITKNGIIDKSFIVCNKNSPFIKKWKEEYLKLANYGTIEAYMDSCKINNTMKILINNAKNNPIDNAIIVAGQKVLETYPKSELSLFSPFFIEVCPLDKIG